MLKPNENQVVNILKWLHYGFRANARNVQQTKPFQIMHSYWRALPCKLSIFPLHAEGFAHPPGFGVDDCRAAFGPKKVINSECNRLAV